MPRTFSIVRGALSAVLVLVAGCGAATPPGPGSLPTSPGLSECRAEPARAVVCLRAGEKRAEGTLLVGEARQQAVHGSGCWQHGDGRGEVACVDTAWPLFPRGYLEVSKGVELLVDADSETVGVFLYRVTQRDGRRELGRVRDVELDGRSARLRIEPGRYLLEVVATWPKGDADLVFGIRVAGRKG